MPKRSIPVFSLVWFVNQQLYREHEMAIFIISRLRHIRRSIAIARAKLRKYRVVG